MLITVFIAAFVIGVVLFFMPKFATGRLLYTESFVPEFQVYRMLRTRDLSNISVSVEIAHRKLYRYRIFSIFKPVFELLPSKYSVKADKDGGFRIWAYPFDIVHIRVGEQQFRDTFTLRHKVDNFSSRIKNFYLALMSLFSPRLLHDECIEIPTTLGKTCGYADKLSVSAGEEVNLMVSTSAESFSVEFTRVGQTLETLDEVKDIPGKYQIIKTKFPSALGCGWEPTLKYRVPEGIASGCYILKLKGSNGDDSGFIPLIVRPQARKNRIAVIASTNTWHAYNSWGGQNYYLNYTSFPSKYILSADRPFDLYVRNTVEETCGVSRDHLLVGERYIWAWLEREGYGYDLYTDEDLHSKEIYNDLISKYDILIISTHNEYWSYEMIDHLKTFIKDGGNVMSLSGDAVYKEVEYLKQNLIILDGALFRYQGLCEESILGVSHDIRGFTTWAPYKVMESEHWIFEGTKLNNGDLIGDKGLNVSPDEEPGASGWETDKIYPQTPDGTTLLARGLNPDEGGADMVIYQDPGCGSVFSVGSISFGGSLLVDDNTSKITKNIIHRFLQNTANGNGTTHSAITESEASV